ncbi:hypothetical protein AAC387_Pa06g0504 [Persea americana]
MGLGSEDQKASAPTVESRVESQKGSKISYGRDFLLSVCELDICKSLPVGFDTLALSELVNASPNVPERQRISGDLSLHRYGSALQNRVDSSSNYSRGSHVRWDTRSSGSNDRDGDSSSDWDSVTQGSGKHYGNHSRRNWQHPECDGLLGSGSLQRPSGYTGGATAPRAQGNDHYQLNRSSEPYHPPRYYKALSHTDSRDDETFGSAECSSEDRAEEERKRRASFELMRKGQQKALQEKQKHPDKHKEQPDSDIAVLLENSEDEKNLWNKSDGSLEDHSHMESVSQGDAIKCDFPAQAPASRPFVPPGFASATLEKNHCPKSLVPSPAPEVGNIGFEANAHAKSNVYGNGRETEKQSAASHEQKCKNRCVDARFMGANERTLIPSADAEASNCFLSFGNPYSKSTGLLEASEGSVDSEVASSDIEKATRFKVGAVGQDQSTSTLEELFNDPLAVNGVSLPSFIEHSDDKSNEDAWSAQPWQASKFAHWFLEEEKKPVDDISSSKNKDLLSLIVSSDKVGSHVSTVSDEKAIGNMPRFFPSENTEVAQEFVMSFPATSTTVGNTEPFYHNEKPDVCSEVLTCEDLEQSILSDVKDSGSHVQHSTKGAWSFMDAELEPQKSAVNDHASQHLLSLLQKGTISKGSTTSTSSPHMSSSGKHSVHDSVIWVTENVQNTDKTPTLETLFGTTFMKDLHSVEAPVSVNRGSTSGGACTAVSEPQGLPFSIGGDGFFHSTVNEHASNKGNLNQVPQLDKIEGHWSTANDIRSRSSRREADGGFGSSVNGVLDIQLPEEESLIAESDPLHHEKSQFMPMKITARTDKFISSEPPAEIVEKLAALNAILKNERLMTPGRPPVLHDHQEQSESDVMCQHLHMRSPRFPIPYQMNNAKLPFHSLDQHAVRSPQIRFIGPEDIIHQDPRIVFQPNVHHPSHGLGGPRFDPVYHSALQHRPMPGNFQSPNMLHGMPRGPLPHPLNYMPGYLPEMNPVKGFPLNHQQTNYSGLGMGLPGSGGGGGSYPEVLERLAAMQLRENEKPTPSVAAGHGLGIYHPELKMTFRYR